MLTRPVTGPSFDKPAVTKFVPPSTAAPLPSEEIVSGPDLDSGALTESADPWRSDAIAAAKGDRAAFERLYRAHTQRVFSVCMRMVTDRNKAEELTQDVFVRVWQKLPTFRGDSQVSTWLHRVTVNVVLTNQKSDNAGKNRAVSDDEAIELTPGRAAFVGERLDLDAAIARLPRGARQVFVLHDVEGFTHEEIGEQLGISPGGSKAQLHRARMLLRQALSR
ncbi:MAG: RNA polymerase sigma factor [Gemmatimonadaceae bacterium]